MVEAGSKIYEHLGELSVILTLIISALVIIRAIIRGYKSYVDDKLTVVNMEISTIKKNAVDYKYQNEKEHDRLTSLFDKIDEKLDKLIEKN